MSAGMEVGHFRSGSRDKVQIKNRELRDRNTRKTWNRKDEMITLENLKNMKEKKRGKSIAVKENEPFIFLLWPKWHCHKHK